MGCQGSPSQLLTHLCSTTHGCFKCKSRFSLTAPNLLFSWQRTSPWTQLSNLTLTVTAGHSSSLTRQAYLLQAWKIHSLSPQLHCQPPTRAASSSGPSSCSHPQSLHLLLLPTPVYSSPCSQERLESSKGLPALGGRHRLQYNTPRSTICQHYLRQTPTQTSLPSKQSPRLLDGVMEPRGRTEARTKHSDVRQAPSPSKPCFSGHGDLSHHSSLPGSAWPDAVISSVKPRRTPGSGDGRAPPLDHRGRPHSWPGRSSDARKRVF